MAKYEGWRGRLKPVMTFEELGALVGGLPPSAYRHRTWWSNNPQGHTHARMWLDQGWSVEWVDLGAQKVGFTRD